MQITSSGYDNKLRNYSGTVGFPGLYQPQRESKHYKEPKKSRSQIMNLRRLRKFMRTDNRKKRGSGAGALGLIIVFLFVLMAIVLAALGVPLRG